MNSEQFLAGAAKVEITPPLGTYINGDFVAHYATVIHSSLYAKAIVIRKEGILAALVVVDICSMTKDYVDTIKAKIFAETAIKPEHILISCTHTHAAGAVAEVYLGAADVQYMNKLPDLIVKATVLAKAKLRPAKIAWGSCDVPEHVLCRRYLMKKENISTNPVSGNYDKVFTNPFGNEEWIQRANGITDPELSFLLIKGLDEEWISVLANYSLHYVGDWDNGTISSDYFGEFAKQLHANLKASDDFIAIMSNGTSGDVNIWDFLNPERYPSENYLKSKLIGSDLANRLCQHSSNVVWDNNPSLNINYKELSITLRKPNAEELDKAKKTVATNSFERFVLSPDSLKNLYAREQVLLDDLPNDINFPLHAFKIGEGVLTGLCGEIFAETGLFIKNNLNIKSYFTIGLANGNEGYVPPKHEFVKGGYETWRSRVSKLDEDAEELIRTELIKQVKLLVGQDVIF